MARPVVPTISPDIVLPPQLDSLREHLDHLAADPTARPDPVLFDDFQLYLTDAASVVLLPQLLPDLIQVLTLTEAGLTPVTRLLTRLTRPLSFPAVLALVPASALTACLDSPSTNANALGLALVAKAGQTPNTLASHPPLLHAILRCWLSTPSAAVGDGLGRLLVSALQCDARWGVAYDRLPPPPGRDTLPPIVGRLIPPNPPGHTILWPAIFDDPAALRLILDPCHGDAIAISPLQRSLAQDRLLRVLPHLAALDLPFLCRPGPATVLRTAALDMVDPADDLMLHCLCDFFVDFVCFIRVSRWATLPDWVGLVQGIVREAARRHDSVLDALRRIPERVGPDVHEKMCTWVSFVLDTRFTRPPN